MRRKGLVLICAYLNYVCFVRVHQLSALMRAEKLHDVTVRYFVLQLVAAAAVALPSTLRTLNGRAR